MDKELFDELVTGLNEMVDFEKGALDKSQVDTRHISPRFKSRALVSVDKGAPHIAALRAELHLSQSDFAKVLGVSAITVSSWEQGLRHPSGAVAKLMILLENDPSRVNELVEI